MEFSPLIPWFLHAEGFTRLVPCSRLRPRWVLGHNATPALLSTRYQQVNQTDFARQHNLYEWTDKPPYEHLTLKTFQRGLSNLTHAPSGKESITICMIGASHAYYLAEQGNNLRIKHVNFAFESTRYPELFDVRVLANCTYAVLSYGQWPLSFWMGKEPYSADRYEVGMRRILRDVVSYSSVSNTKVFMRSMNFNGFGSWFVACPTIDYRHPPLVMMYNSIMSNLCAEYSVPFIDTHHLQGPLWDIALDWSHPKGRVFTAQVEFIVHYVLSYSHLHNLPVLLDPDFAARTKGDVRQPPIRFNDSSTEYMLLHGEYRTFPDAATKFHLGYSNMPTTVYNASLKGKFKFGAPLPAI